MKVDLKNYMDERDSARSYENVAGPVITISRQHGCDAALLAQKLIWRISKSSKGNKWKYIDKEILEKAAKELRVSTSRVEEVMDSKPVGVVEDLFSSFTTHYGATSKRVQETIKDVLLSYSNQGKVVIIGRGGALSCGHIPNSLHIKLQAPFTWRVNQLRKKYNMGQSEAETECQEIDEKRKTWKNQLDMKEYDDSIYDIILNRHTLNDDEILGVIFTLLKLKGIVYE